MSLTTAEAARQLGTTEENVRKLVERDRIKPIRPGARPLRFRELDVIELIHERKSQSDLARIAGLADEFLRRVVASL